MHRVAAFLFPGLLACALTGFPAACGSSTVARGSGGISGSGGELGSGGADGSGGDSGSGGGVGSGGKTGSGGEAGSGSGGSGGSAGASGAGGATGVDCTGEACKIQLVYIDGARTDTTSRPVLQLDLVNWGFYSARLSQVSVRYWYTEDYTGVDPTKDNIFEMYYVAIGNANLHHAFKPVTPARPEANYYLELTFSDPPGYAFVETGNINVAFHKSNEGGANATYTQTNDWSADPTATAWQENHHITVYLDGVLVYGTEPPL